MGVRSFLAGIAAGASRQPGEKPAGTELPAGPAPPADKDSQADQERQADPAPSAGGRQPGESHGHPLAVAVVAAVAGAVAGAAIPLGAGAIYHHIHDPPGIETLTRLMNAEAAASMAPDIAKRDAAVRRLYAPGAVVTDAGCQTRGASRVWAGLSEVESRYQALPRFFLLRHVHAQVLWQPDNSGASTADVTAKTFGVIRPSASSAGGQVITGNELWTFALVRGTWVVTSFTYNLCLPASQGG